MGIRDKQERILGKRNMRYNIKNRCLSELISLLTDVWWC